MARGVANDLAASGASVGGVQTDPGTNTVWSLGPSAINALRQASDGYLEYFVTLGVNNDEGRAAWYDFRIFRTTSAFTFQEGMDADKTGTQVWLGGSWQTVTYSCYSGDAGPCWEPGSQNICCRRNAASGAWESCAQGTSGGEGQWSALVVSNRNQHLRCSVSDYDQDSCARARPAPRLPLHEPCPRFCANLAQSMDPVALFPSQPDLYACTMYCVCAVCAQDGALCSVISSSFACVKRRVYVSGQLRMCPVREAWNNLFHLKMIPYPWYRGASALASFSAVPCLWPVGSKMQKYPNPQRPTKSGKSRKILY